MKPRFSIAIPVYNRPDYLRQAIRSSLGQSTQDLEVVISDDCSTENLRAVVDSFRDKRIKYSRSTDRLGAARNHQRAVSLANGEFVVVLNSDDLLLPDCLQSAAAALDQQRSAAAVYFSPTYLTGAKVHGFHPMPKVRFADRSTLLEKPWLEKFTGTSPTCCLFRKEAFDSIGGYRTSLRLAYDWELYIRFLMVGGGVAFLPQVLCVYRVHDAQMVQTSSIDGLWDMLDLWQLKEYSHWIPSDLGNLVLAQVRLSMRRKGDWLNLIAQIRPRASLRLGVGIGQAILMRLRKLAAPASHRNHFASSGDYEAPHNHEQASRDATLLLSN